MVDPNPPPQNEPGDESSKPEAGTAGSGASPARAGPDGAKETTNLGDLAAKAKSEGLLGQIISQRYRIVQLLAMGGVGAVYLAEHVHMHKHVAVKLLHPDAQSLPELSERFEREAIAGAHITHPNVAAATDFGRTDDGSFFLVLEFVPGITLRELINRGPVPPLRAALIGKQLALALAATHGKGIVHRDVKPRNVMVVEGARGDVVKLIDFGLAKFDLTRISTIAVGNGMTQSARITGTGAVFGTIAYLAPEAAKGMDSVDARADLYALGIVLYELLTGAPLFETTDPVELFKLHHQRKPTPPSTRTPSARVPRALDALVMKLLEKRPDDRHESAAAVIAELEAILDESATETADPEATGPRAKLPASVAAPPSSAETTGPRSKLPASVAAPPSSAETTGDASAPGPVRPAEPTGPRPPARARWPYVLPAVALAAMVGLALAARLVPAYSGPGAAGESPAPAGPGAPAVVASRDDVRQATLPLATAAPQPVAEAASAGVAPPDPSSALPTVAPAEPFDPAVVRAALRRAPVRKDWAGGLAAFFALVEHDAAFFHDPSALGATRDLAAGVALGGGPDADRMFDALGSKLGSDGPDILFEILKSRGGSRAAVHAAELLRKEEVAARGTPALRIASALRAAPCDAKLELLDRAVAEGDARALLVLQTAGVACFGHLPRLQDAIKALHARLAGR